MISEAGHYRTAEEILGEIGPVPRGRPELAIAMAQVHATLALAAATYAAFPDSSAARMPGMPSFPEMGDADVISR